MKRQKNGVFLVLAAAVLMSFGGLMIKAIPWNAMAVNSGGKTAAQQDSVYQSPVFGVKA